MRVMVIVKATRESESGVLPSREILTEMGRFNEELLKAGVMLCGEGLHGQLQGRARQIRRRKSTVTDGPFTETKELIAGFWLWQVKSLEEAVEWIRRSPFRKSSEEIEIRRVFEAEDFGANLTPELKAQETRQREHLAAKKLKSHAPTTEDTTMSTTTQTGPHLHFQGNCREAFDFYARSSAARSCLR